MELGEEPTLKMLGARRQSADIRELQSARRGLRLPKEDLPRNISLVEAFRQKSIDTRIRTREGSAQEPSSPMNNC